MDVVISFGCSLLALPLIALHRRSRSSSRSRGPVFFVQERIGRGAAAASGCSSSGRWSPDAEKRGEELRGPERAPGLAPARDDPRITRVGRFLRHTSIDELPQLWNVLRGDMSLVGPRPMPARRGRAHLAAGAAAASTSRRGSPGSGRCSAGRAIPFEEMVKLDYLYVTNWSLWQDVRLLDPHASGGLSPARRELVG